MGSKRSMLRLFPESHGENVGSESPIAQQTCRDLAHLSQQHAEVLFCRSRIERAGAEGLAAADNRAAEERSAALLHCGHGCARDLIQIERRVGLTRWAVIEGDDRSGYRRGER